VSLAQSLKHYSETRFTWFPWRILPFYLVMISGVGSWDLLHLFFTHMLGLFVFRILDDYGSRHFDQRYKNRTLKLESPRFVLFILTSSWLSMLASFGGFHTFLIGLALIGVSSFLYALVQSEHVEKISLLKYPFFVLYPFIEMGIKTNHIILAMLTTLAVFIYDLKDRTHYAQKYPLYLIFFIPLAFALFMR
jgi:hypothetical protein